MKPIQLTEYGKKHWLVEMPGPCLGGGRNVARTEGQNGSVLLFDSKPEAEVWIKDHPEWIKRKPTYVTPGTAKDVPGDEWAGLNVKELAAVVAVSEDVGKLQAIVDKDERVTAVKAASRRLDELEAPDEDA